MTALEDLVQKAKDGDRHALESVVHRIRDRVYGLALRMLAYPADAEDATQEILVKVIARLDTFGRESRFTTWVHRVAVNHLLDTRKRLNANQPLSFEDCGLRVQMKSTAEWQESIPEPERNLMVQEVTLNCFHGMLLYLDRAHRITYILSEVLDLSSLEGAYILDISPATFRKRLSRARERIRSLVLEKCGLVDPDNPCHCDRLTSRANQPDVMDPTRLSFEEYLPRTKGGALCLDHLGELDSLQRAAASFRNHSDASAPDTFLQGLKKLVDSGQVGLFQRLH